MDLDVTIDPRFCGPPTSGNGGWTCGLLGTKLGGTVEVTLRKPPPLGRPLRLTGQGQGQDNDELRLLDGEELLAEARRVHLDLEVPPAPSFNRAVALSSYYVGHRVHYYPTCFTCGPARAAGDGLRIFAGRERPEDPVAGAWVPAASLADATGRVSPEVHWAALDCPGYFGAAAPDHPPALLGRMTAQVSRSVSVGEHCVVVGWSLGRQGRKLHAGTALYGEDGRLIGRARQVWITVAP
jgi:hypothetical protein